MQNETLDCPQDNGGVSRTIHAHAHRCTVIGRCPGRGQCSLWGRGARRTLEYSRWLSVSNMVPRRGDLNSRTALRVLALVLMCAHCKGEIQDAPAVPAEHCDVGQHGAGAGWLDGQQLAHPRFDASLHHGHVWKDSKPTPALARTLASGQGDVPGDKRSGPWRSWDHYGAQPDLRPANQPSEDKWQTVMADVRPGTKPREP